MRCAKNASPFNKPRDHFTKDATVIYRASHIRLHWMPDEAAVLPEHHQRARSIVVCMRTHATWARKLAATPQYEQSMRDRKKVDMLFAHLKRILNLGRLRLRGLSGAPRTSSAGSNGSERATNGEAAFVVPHGAATT
jgi:hypothetical protein